MADGASRRRNWGVRAGEVVSLRARVCAPMHKSVHECTAVNRCTRHRATTEGQRLGATEVDRGGAPRGGDAVLRTEKHGWERAFPMMVWSRARPCVWPQDKVRSAWRENRGNTMERRRCPALTSYHACECKDVCACTGMCVCVHRFDRNNLRVRPLMRQDRDPVGGRVRAKFRRRSHGDITNPTVHARQWNKDKTTSWEKHTLKVHVCRCVVV